MPKRNNMKAAWLSILLLASVLCMVCQNNAFGEQDKAGSASTGVVFVVETSSAVAKVDQRGLVAHAIKLTASLLGPKDEFGLIKFDGKAASVVKGITTVGQKDAIFKAIDSMAKPSLDNITSLNPFNALSLALGEFSNDNSTATDRVIVFIGTSKTYGDSAEQDKKIRSSIMNQLVPSLKDKGVRVFTVSLGVASDKDFMDDLSANTGGFSFFSPLPTTLNTTLARIYDTIKSPDRIPAGSGHFVADESIEQLTIVLSKKTPESKPVLQGPDGENYNSDKSRAGVSWTKFYNFDLVKISSPASGVWNILNVDDENNRIYASTQLKVRTNFKSSYQEVNTPVKIDAWLSLDNLIIDIGQLPEIGLTVDITEPDGETSSKLVLKAQGVSNDKKGADKEKTKADKEKKDPAKASNIFSDSFTPKTSGLYRLTISVKSKSIERSRSFLIAAIDKDRRKYAATAETAARVEEKTEASEKEKTDAEDPAVEDHMSPNKQSSSEKTIKKTTWLNKYVRQSKSDLKHALIWFITINIVLFLAILLYIKRDVVAKIKFSEMRLPKMRLPKVRLPKIKMPDIGILLKYFKRPKETHDQD
ncbi:MAG: VWA domain-containing protein [Candidatus Magnetominusculus sp. LBB02]|nr:VWA domain-containing protein [Candidatus Magnetominusculus sp. LBB02]